MNRTIDLHVYVSRLVQSRLIERVVYGLWMLTRLIPETNQQSARRRLINGYENLADRCIARGNRRKAKAFAADAWVLRQAERPLDYQSALLRQE
jgi:hypothetical protein